jgi:hypothetical protein
MITRALDAGGDGDGAGQRWLLIRRRQRTGELAIYHCWVPQPIPLAALYALLVLS